MKKIILLSLISFTFPETMFQIKIPQPSSIQEFTGDESKEHVLQFIDISCLNSTCLGIDIDNKLWGIGSNSQGELGLGDTEHRNRWTYLKKDNVKKIITGRNTSAYFDLNNNLWITGKNDYGKLGLNLDYTVTDKILDWTQIDIPNISISDFSISRFATYILGTNGNVYSAGHLSYTGTQQMEPKFVYSGINNIRSIVSATASVLAIKNNNDVYRIQSTGSQNLYQTTEAGTTNVWKKYYSINNVDSVFLKGHYHIAKKTDGTYHSIGNNRYGQLALGTEGYNYNRSTWTLITRLSDIEKQGIGYGHAYYYKDNTIYSVGWNSHGQLGTDDLINKSVPTESLSINNVKKIEASTVNGVILTNDYKVFVVGYNGSNVLQLGVDVESTPTWTEITPIGYYED